MKKEQNTKSSLDITAKIKVFPQCINKKQARMVCLNDACDQYAFFCLQCDDESCQITHRHQNKEDKFEAISFKEFIRRVLKQRKPIEQLENATNTYKQTLERLRTDINEFVEKELNSLNEIIKKTTEVPEDLLPIVKKLRDQKYAGLLGKEMDFLWKNCGETPQSIRLQHETADFVKIKEEELKAISEHFQNLNKMELDKMQEGDEEHKGINPLANQARNGSRSPQLGNKGKVQSSNSKGK